jgi:pSer/pThr/pTyr-binding forkhead associated (FHA) protein
LEPDPTGLPAGSALIVLERGPNAGSRFLLDQPVTSVGRHPRSDIFLDDVTVSRRHVELRWEKDDFHDHVAWPQCRQRCKCRDRRHKAPKKKPSLGKGR